MSTNLIGISLLSERIKLLRSYKGLSQAKFAKLISYEGVNILQSSIADIESGKVKKPSSDVLIGISINMMEISLNWLLKGEGDMLNDDAKKVTPFDLVNRISSLTEKQRLKLELEIEEMETLNRLLESKG